MEEEKIAITGMMVVMMAAAVSSCLQPGEPESPTPPPEPAPEKANLYGIVTDASTGSALADVLATLNGMETYADSTGGYSFADLDPGTYSVRFEKDGYHTVGASVTLQVGNNELNVAMVAKTADIRLENLTIEPDEADVGEEVTISVTATNYGEVAGSKTVVLTVGSTTVEQTVELESDESRQVVFKVSPSTEGTYQVSVNGLTGSFTAVIRIVPWAFSNVTCSVGPSGVGTWRQVNFSATITNTGDSAATKTVTQYRRDYRMMWSDETMGWYWEWSDWRVIKQITLTLLAGQSYNYTSPGNDLIQTPCTAECYLVDSDGYKSSVCRVSN